MNQTAAKVIPIYKTHTPAVRTGSVVSDIPEALTVMMDKEIRPARTAFSCLIVPRAKDQVICTEDDAGTVYVLGILARPGTQEMMLSFPSDTAVRTQKGGLTIESQENVSIVSPTISSFSKTQIHKSREAIISCDKTTLSGSELQASFKTVQIISNLINTMARQVISRFKGYVRHTENSDMVKAGQMVKQSRGLFSIDAEHTIMNSKKCTKIDGEKILMG